MRIPTFSPLLIYEYYAILINNTKQAPEPFDGFMAGNQFEAFILLNFPPQVPLSRTKEWRKWSINLQIQARREGSAGRGDFMRVSGMKGRTQMPK